MKPVIAPEQRGDFIRDWIAGMRCEDMAAKYGCARSSVSMNARRFGLTPRNNLRRDSSAGGADLALMGGTWRPGRHGVLFWYPDAA